MSSDSCQSLLRAIADRTCTVGVIGLGYVGLPLIDAFTQAGFQCIGFDVDPGKVKSSMAFDGIEPSTQRRQNRRLD